MGQEALAPAAVRTCPWCGRESPRALCPGCGLLVDLEAARAEAEVLSRDGVLEDPGTGVGEPAQPAAPAGMVAVPAGPFLFGGGVVRSLDLFFIDRTPVTHADYARFVAATGHPPPRHWTKGRPPPGKEDHPVVGVTYADACAYAAWAGKDLPTEEEWEKAARGTDGRLYPWGNTFLAGRANVAGSGRRDTSPVDAHPRGASPWGCLDMAGNVWEWTHTAAAAGRPERVLKGGSWYDFSVHARTPARFSAPPDHAGSTVGFRCVVRPGGPSHAARVLRGRPAACGGGRTFARRPCLPSTPPPPGALPGPGAIAALRARLERVLTPPPPPAARTRQPRRAYPWAWGGAGAALFVSLLFLFLSGRDRRPARVPAPPPPPPAAAPAVHAPGPAPASASPASSRPRRVRKGLPPSRPRRVARPAPVPPPGMAYIPPGPFRFGRDGVLRTLRGFFIDIHEVTNGEYARFVAATGHPPPPHWRGPEPPPGLERHPVTFVDVYDAQAYARWAGKRLPTEEEWEKAARGPDGRIFPWGSEPDLARAHLYRPGAPVTGTVPVGSFPQGASPYGVEDLVGNVLEWTATRVGERYVLKGGSWGLSREGGAVVHRYLFFPPETRSSIVGFRCVRDAQP